MIITTWGFTFNDHSLNLGFKNESGFADEFHILNLGFTDNDHSPNLGLNDDDHSLNQFSDNDHRVH